MNNTSGSALQKISFVLVLIIAAALGYFIVRLQFRGQQERADTAVAALSESNLPISPASAPVSSKPSYAPLRARVETNVVRVGTNRPILVGRTVALSPQVATDSPIVVSRTIPGDASSSPGGALVGDRQSTHKNSTVTGRVILHGKPPPETTAAVDAMCGSLRKTPLTTRHYVVGSDLGLANAFVYVKAGAPAAPAAPAATTRTILDQVGCEYQPYVLGVVTGQTFTVKNSDTVFHNVHALPKIPGNREKNVAQPVKGMTTAFSFAAPELFVQFKCEVHPWMFAYVGVLDHPWFAVTDRNGNFSLPPGLPPGNYTLAARHLKAGEVLQQINVTETGVEPVTFTLDVPEGLAKADTP